MNLRKRWHLLALALLVGLSGCSSSGLVKVTGRVTHNGQPVPNTIVRFVPQDMEKGRISEGRTDENGRFTLVAAHKEPGALCGRYAVSLRYAPAGDEESGNTSQKVSELKELIAKYDDPMMSGLRYEVTKDGDYFDIELH
jgi:hypothetical protein